VVSSSGSGSTTVNCSVPTAETLPALSVARYRTVCAPTAVTATGVV
jgi:hypothetical protein